jgi:CYTH domain-containing protein
VDGQQGFLTIKGRMKAINRAEYEIPVRASRDEMRTVFERAVQVDQIR